ncbi:hypothetical protein [Wielerella bovis]|uniref:hypothetical protein n=1 Tax=Wielerella bovis TaxID=2917790 RepID=UPI002018F15B|nr:hypothetical protein [Wielerella bovis]ULJ60707.1 hypothetical protein MIS44_02205 [Wielerella bovis]
MKQFILPTLIFLLSACGKSGAERYVGYWQEHNDKYVIVSEIKKENGNYFVVSNIVAEGKAAEKQTVLSEKEGELVFNLGIGDMPLKLSDDGKTLFVDKKSFTKIDTSTKDKIMAHEAKCRQLSDEFAAETKTLPNVMSQEYKAAQEALQQKYFPQFEQLEQEMLCNRKPLDYKILKSRE